MYDSVQGERQLDLSWYLLQPSAHSYVPKCLTKSSIYTVYD